MPSNKLSNLISFIIAKFIFTVIIWLLFFGYNIWSVWENEIDILYNNLYQSNFNNKNDYWHHIAEIPVSSENSQFNSLCNTYKNYCDIVDVTKVTDIKKANEYKIITMITLSKISYFFSTKYNLSNALNSIQIKDEKWEQRGYANHNNIFININNLSTTEYIQVLVHELGHIIDLWMIKWIQQEKNKEFTEFSKSVFSRDDISILFYQLSRENEFTRKKTAQKTDFCTIYGMTNPFEDFAECFNLYINHHDYFTTIEKSSDILHEKYNIIDKIVNGNYLDSINTFPLNQSSKYRYRDSTRIK